MGLAGIKAKQRFGLDPRNTSWSKNTGRFGHQYLEKMGWAPGKGLGLVDHAATTHVKVSIKEDKAGLGFKLARSLKKDEFDSGECAGLDVFQRILGRLNGNQDLVNRELERKRTDNIINGKCGIHFVKGEILESTWNSGCKLLKSKRSTFVIKRSRKKMKMDESDEKKAKRKKNEKNEKKKKKKGLKKSKEKVVEKEYRESSVTRDEMLQSRSNTAEIATRLSARSKWIKQKRASVMDAKALNEIFMITNS